MPTVASVPLRALATRRDSAAASSGRPGEVQMRGAAAAGAGGGVPAGPGVLPGAAVLAGGLVLEGVLAGARVPAGAGAAAEPEISRAESARTHQGHRPG